MREVHRRIAAGDRAAELALDVYCYRIKKYVGAYLAALGGADAIAFTAGVGENDPVVRARSLAGLRELGIEVDDGAQRRGRTGDLDATDSPRIGPRRPDRRGARDGRSGRTARLKLDEHSSFAPPRAPVVCGRTQGRQQWHKD